MPLLQGVAASVRGGVTGLPALVRRHRLFSAVLALAIVPRVIAMLGYQPAILFKLDTYDYLWDAAHLQPNVVNPNGYSLFLWLLRPAHSLALVAGIQHVLGLASAVAVYAIMRRFGAPSWAGTLAAVTLLFDPATFLSEQLIMADLLAMVLMIMAFAVLLLRDQPSVPRVAVAGLLLGASAVVRPTTLPLIVFFGAYLLLRRAGWRRVLSVLAGGVLPVAAYLCWFAAVHGSFNLSNSNGLFLWSRTMSFANCSVIKPPADLVALCPGEQPRQRAVGVNSPRLLPKVYLWDHNAWMWRDEPSTGVVPDVAAFTPANNQRALSFAIKAIEAQPLSYARQVGDDIATPFISRDVFPFPGPVQPRLTDLAPANRAYALAAVQAYVGSTAGIGPYLGHPLGTRLVEPYAHLLRGYQSVIFVPGPLFALVVALGLAGIVLPRRRVGAAVLLWTSAVVTVVLPIAEHEYTYRYVIPAVPLACMAAALGWALRPQPGSAGDPELSPELPESVRQP